MKLHPHPHRHLPATSRERRAPARHAHCGKRTAQRDVRSRRGSLGIVCAPAATYRGYTITVVLDRLAPSDPWAGRAAIAFARTPNRPVLILDFDNLPRQRGGDRARSIVLRAALSAIDGAQDNGRGIWIRDAAS